MPLGGLEWLGLLAKAPAGQSSRVLGDLFPGYDRNPQVLGVAAKAGATRGRHKTASRHRAYEPRVDNEADIDRLSGLGEPVPITSARQVGPVPAARGRVDLDPVPEAGWQPPVGEQRRLGRGGLAERQRLLAQPPPRLPAQLDVPRRTAELVAARTEEVGVIREFGNQCGVGVPSNVDCLAPPQDRIAVDCGAGPVPARRLWVGLYLLPDAARKKRVV